MPPTPPDRSSKEPIDFARYTRESPRGDLQSGKACKDLMGLVLQKVAGVNINTFGQLLDKGFGAIQSATDNYKLGILNGSIVSGVTPNGVDGNVASGDFMERAKEAMRLHEFSVLKNGSICKNGPWCDNPDSRGQQIGIIGPLWKILRDFGEKSVAELTTPVQSVGSDHTYPAVNVGGTYGHNSIWEMKMLTAEQCWRTVGMPPDRVQALLHELTTAQRTYPDDEASQATIIDGFFRNPVVITTLRDMDAAKFKFFMKQKLWKICLHKDQQAVGYFLKAFSELDLPMMKLLCSRGNIPVVLHFSSDLIMTIGKNPAKYTLLLRAGNLQSLGDDVDAQVLKLFGALSTNACTAIVRQVLPASPDKVSFPSAVSIYNNYGEAAGGLILADIVGTRNIKHKQYKLRFASRGCRELADPVQALQAAGRLDAWLPHMYDDGMYLAADFERLDNERIDLVCKQAAKTMHALSTAPDDVFRRLIALPSARYLQAGVITGRVDLDAFDKDDKALVGAANNRSFKLKDTGARTDLQGFTQDTDRALKAMPVKEQEALSRQATLAPVMQSAPFFDGQCAQFLFYDEEGELDLTRELPAEIPHLQPFNFEELTLLRGRFGDKDMSAQKFLPHLKGKERMLKNLAGLTDSPNNFPLADIIGLDEKVLYILTLSVGKIFSTPGVQGSGLANLDDVKALTLESLVTLICTHLLGPDCLDTFEDTKIRAAHSILLGCHNGIRPHHLRDELKTTFGGINVKNTRADTARQLMGVLE